MTRDIENNFCKSIIGTGLIAISVLASSCGYVLSDLLGWKEGLSKKFSQDHFFVILLQLLV